MRRRSAVIAIALVATPLLALADGFTNPAEAGGWFVGGAFRVGGVHFSLAFDDGRRHHRPYYYYRTAHPVRHRGYGCGDYCFKQSRYVYHHPGCPLVLQHFRVNRFHPARIWHGVRVPPSFRYYGYWGQPGYDAWRGRAPYHPDYYGRGYDDYYGRYDDRGHRGHRGHRHGPHCRH